MCSKETKRDNVDLNHLAWVGYQWRASYCEQGVTVWTVFI
jgi:hypothetical protein